jgi:hypothetical protein
VTNDLVTSGRACITATGATFLPGIPYENMEGFIVEMCRVRRGVTAAIGDALNYAEREYGETYAQLEASTGYSPGYLANLKWVFGSVPIENRIDGLGMSYYQVVAPITDMIVQRTWLETAWENGWTRDELRLAVNGAPRERQKTTALRDVVQEFVWAYRKGDSIERWVKELETMLSHWR